MARGLLMQNSHCSMAEVAVPAQDMATIPGIYATFLGNILLRLEVYQLCEVRMQSWPVCFLAMFKHAVVSGSHLAMQCEHLLCILRCT